MICSVCEMIKKDKVNILFDLFRTHAVQPPSLHGNQLPFRQRGWGILQALGLRKLIILSAIQLSFQLMKVIVLLKTLAVSRLLSLFWGR